MARIVVIALTIALLAITGVTATASMVVVPMCQGQPATIVGTNKADVLTGTKKRDVIVGRGGKDVIYGKGGNDLICGGIGNDIIRGGAGLDRIVGGAGKDACYPGRGGAVLKSCEGADLRVTVTSPPTAEIGDPGFTFLVTVRNIGSKAASGVALQIDFMEQGTSCSIDHSGVFPIGKLKPGAHIANDYLQTCGVLAEGGVVTLSATATTTSVDDNLSNNQAQSSTTLFTP